MLAMLSILELLIALAVGGILLTVLVTGGVIIYAAIRRGARNSARNAVPPRKHE